MTDYEGKDCIFKCLHILIKEGFFLNSLKNLTFLINNTNKLKFL